MRSTARMMGGLLAVAVGIVGSSFLVGCEGKTNPSADTGAIDAGRDAQPDAGGADAGDSAIADASEASVDGGVDTGLDAGDSGLPALPPRRVVYQLVVRYFGNLNETRTTDGTLAQNGVGKFAHINDAALDSLLALGVTDVWLTGAIRQATLTDYSSVDPRLNADDPDVVKGRAGSFYAIRDYYDVSPDYAENPANRMAEFEALVARIHAKGLKVILDFVPNHVARGYGSVVFPDRDFGVGDNTSAFYAANNSFYYLAGQGALMLSRPNGWSPNGLVFDGLFAREDGMAGRNPRVTGNNQTSASPSANDWYETVKLNYGRDFTNGTSMFTPVPSTWTKMDQILAYWQSKGVDGFRCDFAHYVPDEAWTYLNNNVHMRDANAYMFAEAYNDSRDNLTALLQSGFDAVYDDAPYDTLKRLYQGQSSQNDVNNVFNAHNDDVRGRYVRYLENHDETRIASPVNASGGDGDSGFGGMNAGYQLAPLMYLASQGPILMLNGQEVGEAGAGVEGFQGNDGRTSLFDYWSMPSMVRFANGHAFDGANSTAEERALRSFYAQLIALSQDRSALASRYWGLDYFNDTSMFQNANNNLYSFARFETGSGRVMVVVANFAPGTESTGAIRLPNDLMDAAGLPAGNLFVVRRVFGRNGAESASVGAVDRNGLSSNGFSVTIPDQSAAVFIVE